MGWFRGEREQSAEATSIQPVDTRTGILLQDISELKKALTVFGQLPPRSTNELIRIGRLNPKDDAEQGYNPNNFDYLLTPSEIAHGLTEIARRQGVANVQIGYTENGFCNATVTMYRHDGMGYYLSIKTNSHLSMPREADDVLAKAMKKDLVLQRRTLFIPQKIDEGNIGVFDMGDFVRRLEQVIGEGKVPQENIVRYFTASSHNTSDKVFTIDVGDGVRLKVGTRGADFTNQQGRSVMPKRDGNVYRVGQYPYSHEGLVQPSLTISLESDAGDDFDSDRVVPITRGVTLKRIDQLTKSLQKAFA